MNVDPKTMTKDEMINFVSDRLVRLTQEIATILILTSKDESHLLDGIKIANDGIRRLACEGFVEKQKMEGKE